MKEAMNMEKNITIREYMKLMGYKFFDEDSNTNVIDPWCIFMGDIYEVNYKKKYEYFALFEEKTYLKLIMKDAILLRVGFDRFINLTNIRTKRDLEMKINNLKKETTMDRDKCIILGSFFKPFAGDQIVSELKSYQTETKISPENPKVKRILKIFNSN